MLCFYDLISILEEVGVQTTIGIGEFFVSASHYTLGDVEESVEAYLGRALCATFAERGNVSAWEPRAVDVATYAYYGGCVEHGVDACLAMVADDGATELQSCFAETLIGVVPQTHFGVGVLEIGCYGVGAQVAPFAYHCIAQESVVCLV